MTLDNLIAQERLEQLFARELDDADRAIWSRVKPHMAEVDAQTILDVLDEDPSQLVTMTRNLERKIEALTAGDETALQQVVQEELDQAATH